MHGTYIKIDVHVVVLTLFIYVLKQPGLSQLTP